MSLQFVGIFGIFLFCPWIVINSWQLLECYYYYGLNVHALNVHAQFQYHSIPVSVQTYPGLFLCSNSTSLPLYLLSHQSLYYFDEICLLILLVYPGHTLSLFGIHIFIGYHCLAFPFFFPRCQPFPLSCFAETYGFFLGHWFHFSTHVFLASLVWSII